MSRISTLILLAAGVTHYTAAHAETYAEAEQKAQASTTDPTLHDWYSKQMQPEFRARFRLALEQCMNRQQSRPDRVDLVFTVETDGSVGQILWKERSAFTDCLGGFFTNALFPRPPKGVFYFGVGAQLPNSSR